MNLVLSRTMIGLGLVCLTLNLYFYWLRYNPSKLAFLFYKPVQREIHATVLPVGLTIERLGIHTAIVPSEIQNNKWEVSNEAVSYLDTSALPGQKGNSILYGHNWPELLGKLPQVKPGDEIAIFFSDKSHKTFRVENTATVTPDQVHILSPSKDIRITLYTCTGFLDTKRFVVTALLQK